MTLFADQRLDGRVVIVTGSTQGLGEAIALRAAALAAAPADHEAGGAEAGGADGDRLTQALGAAGDDHHAAVEPLDGEQRHATISLTATGRRSCSERSPARPITSGARASETETGGVTPARTAAANASHSRT